MFVSMGCMCVFVQTYNAVHFCCTCVHLCGCVHVCEGEARLLCRGETDTSMVALCPLAQEAKGHETGINYIVRERGRKCVSVCVGGV